MTRAPLQERARALFQHWLDARVGTGEPPDPASLCDDAPELLPHLQSLIDRFRAADALLPSPSRATAPLDDAWLEGAGSDDVRAPAPPSVADYEVIDLLGTGGMGEVWEAQQEAPVRRRVALKVIKRGTDTHQIAARFASERQALASMEHPAIAKVFDAGATDDGRPFFAMEIVRGAPITSYADQHRLTTRQRLELFAQVCEGVQHAHHKGLIHRDLKPSNVLVAESGGAPQAKIIDFGIAKAITPEASDDATLTMLGQVIGTPAYMSPEQADLGNLDVDTRSDVYSLGIMLYELLVGTRPFASSLFGGRDGDREPLTPSGRITGLGDRATEVAERRDTRPRALARHLRGDIDWIVLKALAPERERRYDTPAALADDLRRHLRDEPVLAGPPHTAYRLRKLARRHRVAVAVAVIVILAVMSTLAGLGVGLQRALFAEQQAREQFAAMQSVSDFLVDAFRASDPSLESDAVTARDLLSRASERIQSELHEEPEVRARLASVLAEASMNLGTFDQAEALARDSERLWAEARGDSDPATLTAGNLLAHTLLKRGQLDEAESRFRALLEAESTLRPGSPLEGRIANDLGILMTRRGNFADGEKLYRRALAIHHQQGTEGGRDALRTLINLAAARSGQGAAEEAVDLHREALTMLRELLDEPHVDIATTHNNLASALTKAGMLDEAERHFREALTQRQAVLDAHHPDVAQSLNNVGSARYRAGDYDAAAQYMAQALAVWDVAYDGDHTRLCAALANLGAVARRRGAYDEAEDYLARAAAMEERLHGSDNVRVAAALRRLGVSRVDAGRHADAVAPLERSIAIYESGPGLAVKSTIDAVVGLVAAYRGSGRADDATSLLARVAPALDGQDELAAQIRAASAP